MKKTMRVGIIGIQHESNTFFPERTEWCHFQESIFVTGEEVRRKYERAHTEVSGYLEQLEREGIEPVPLLMAFAMPRGVVSDEALDGLWERVGTELDFAGKLDGFLVAPHGAAVNESRPDMDGWWLGELRQRVGADVPIVAVIDPHANFTAAMAEACDGVIAYQENPHVDQKERGMEAAALMARLLRKEIRPVLRASFSRVAVNIECHRTDEEPMRAVLRQVERVRGTQGVLSASFMMGYPYADVPEMGASFVVMTDDDPKLAESLAAQLGRWLEEHRGAMKGSLIPPETALEKAAGSARPVGLLDMGDNIGGGAPGDSTLLMHLCAEQSLSVFVSIVDPEAAQMARKAGVGRKVFLSMGGKRPLSPAMPFTAEVEVLSLHDGIYGEQQPRHGGLAEFDLGETAIVATGRMVIMLTSKAVLPASANQMLSFGHDPAAYDLLILKGVHSPVAGYREFCRTLIRVNTPGVTTADMESLTYRHRRVPLFPFETGVPCLDGGPFLPDPAI